MITLLVGLVGFSIAGFPGLVIAALAYELIF